MGRRGDHEGGGGQKEVDRFNPSSRSVAAAKEQGGTIMVCCIRPAPALTDYCLRCLAKARDERAIRFRR